METIATYWEKKIKIYGTSERAGLTLVRIDCHTVNFISWNYHIEELKSECSRFELVSAQPAGPDHMIISLLLDKDEAEKCIIRLQGTVEEKGHSAIEVISPVAMIYFHGPHFQERFGIAHSLTSVLTPHEIMPFFFGCSGTSVFIVVAEQDREATVLVIKETFLILGSDFFLISLFICDKNRYLHSMNNDLNKQHAGLDWQYLLFDSLSYPTLILTPEKLIIAANKVFLEQADMELSEVIGSSCQDFFQRHQHELNLSCSQDNCPHAKAVKTKSVQSILKTGVDSSGNETWEERVFSPIPAENGEILYIIESFRDITKLKKLEKLYSGVRELIDKVVQSSVSSIMAANRKGDIILMNEAAEKLFGYSLANTDTINIEDYYPPGVARQVMKMLRDETIGGKGKLPITQVNVINSKGEEIPVEMTAAIIYEGGKETATAAIFNDLREKQAVEKHSRKQKTSWPNRKNSPPSDVLQPVSPMKSTIR